MTRAELLALAAVLQSGADDPMWAHHCEMSKGTAERAAAILRKIAEAQPVAWVHPNGSLAGPKQVEAWGLDALRAHGWWPLYSLQGIIDE